MAVYVKIPRFTGIMTLDGVTISLCGRFAGVMHDTIDLCQSCFFIFCKNDNIAIILRRFFYNIIKIFDYYYIIDYNLSNYNLSNINIKYKAQMRFSSPFKAFNTNLPAEYSDYKLTIVNEGSGHFFLQTSQVI